MLGDIAGAPGILPYSADVYRYMRMLEKASPRVKVFTIGKTEEGREMIAVAVASEKLIASLDENRARLAKLADPRTIKMDDAEAEKLVAASTPIYYITGTIHSPETGAPTALMELAYRLAVDESAYIQAHPRERDHADHAGGGGGRARPHGGHLSLAPGESRQAVAAAWSTGAITWRTTTIATPWG